MWLQGYSTERGTTINSNCIYMELWSKNVDLKHSRLEQFALKTTFNYILLLAYWYSLCIPAHTISLEISNYCGAAGGPAATHRGEKEYLPRKLRNEPRPSGKHLGSFLSLFWWSAAFTSVHYGARQYWSCTVLWYETSRCDRFWISLYSIWYDMRYVLSFPGWNGFITVKWCDFLSLPDGSHCFS